MERRIRTSRVLAVKSCELTSENQIAELFPSFLLWILLLLGVSMTLQLYLRSYR